jgi:hypothetical protein
MAARDPFDEPVGTGADGMAAGVEVARLGALADAMADDRDRREIVGQRGSGSRVRIRTRWSPTASTSTMSSRWRR